MALQAGLEGLGVDLAKVVDHLAGVLDIQDADLGVDLVGPWLAEELQAVVGEDGVVRGDRVAPGQPKAKSVSRY